MIPPTVAPDLIPRDQWGRPVLDGVAYTRVSTLAKTLDDMSALTRWSGRQTAIGLAGSDDLIAAVATTSPDDKQTLNRLVERAQDRAKARRGADLGTAIHAATETLDRGGSLDGIPTAVRADAEAYRRLIDRAGLRPLAAEMFVVCEELHAAGTFDRLLRGPNRVLVADLKTSASADTAKYAALAWSVQIAVYAHARPWLPDRGLVGWTDVGLPEPDLARGLVVHVRQGAGEARLHSIDLTAGWDAARLAVDVRGWRARRDLARPVGV